MKLLAKLAVVFALVAGLSALSVADESVTLQGKVVCAKCVLKKKGLKECQNVLLVPENVSKLVSQKEGLEAKETAYYIVNNDVGLKFGEVCMEAKKTTVTGTVSEKDELKWITPSKMEPIG